MLQAMWCKTDVKQTMSDYAKEAVREHTSKYGAPNGMIIAMNPVDHETEGRPATIAGLAVRPDKYVLRHNVWIKEK